MTTMKAFIARHPVAAFFAFTFVISWGGVLLVTGGPAGMTGVKAQDNPLFPLAVLAMVAGPSLAGILLTSLLDGRAGLDALRSRMLKWRLGLGWYGLALLTAPLLATSVALALSLSSLEFLPAIVVVENKGTLLLLGLVVGLVAGFFEELGWTGFAIPRLRVRHGILATGLIVGVLWSAWHVLVVAWGIGDRAGTISLPLFVIVDGLAALPAFRVLMVQVYDRTESLVIGMLMHVSLTASTLILTPQTTGGFLLIYGVAFAAAVWLVLGALGVTRGGLLAQVAEHERDELLDRFMPVYDVVERHHVCVEAPAAVTLIAAREQDLFRLPLVRAIFRARELVLRAKTDARPQPRGLLAATQALGWGVLAEVSDREIVVGAVTKPWEPNVTFHALAPGEFAAFSQPGLVKIAWTLRVEPVDDATSIFFTETRAVATDAKARARFRRYWAFASPGIAMIRRLSLQPLKRDAEQRARAGALSAA